MSKLVAIVGDTGNGKSHSIQFLDPKETYIINVADKELPFKGSSKLYNRENQNMKVVSDANEIIRLLKTLSEKATHIKNVVIEDGNYIMGFNL
ncbi:MAG: ATP-binding protein, partial [Tissierellales bacterium]|nr:ATP-binding protein [Tissierellales bacterium]